MIKGSKGKEQVLVCWRPDFKDKDRLPDIKPVRTGFFITVFAMSLAAISIIFVGIREYNIFNLKNDISEIQKEIDVYRVENGIIVNRNKEFRDNILKINEIVKFVDEQIVVSDMIIEVASALSEGMEFKKFEYNEDDARFEGRIEAGVDSDSALNGFIENLKAIESLSSRFKNFNQSSVVRQQETGDVDFIVEINNGDEKKDRRKR